MLFEVANSFVAENVFHLIYTSRGLKVLGLMEKDAIYLKSFYILFKIIILEERTAHTFPFI